ncbi:TolC family outer membrane protein [Acidocella sp. KAb 2-4]|uniref:TolC family outer membrane protein n=1 Tax=Acidocella sp. KAb 2-4 TaxID=2885158 RepID=UPI001D0711D8|nr:TolC family outer membrane protein [Acidocella sp. KAb 2-4]MCB5945965.1 TolC family outer membrane protein [Acidocella sp. KAb 2-4]
MRHRRSSHARLAGVALAALGGFAAHPAWANPPSTLTAALAEAYNNNATLQEQRAALRQTDEQVPAALSGWRPTVQISSSISRVSGTQWTQLTPDISRSTAESRNTLTSSATVDQPIYRGGKTLASVREAKNQVFAARAQLLATEQSVFTNVVNAYVTVITDKQLLALQESNEQVLQQQLQDTQTQFNVGEITMTSVAQAQASLAQAKEQVEVAKGNLEIARENFRQLVGDYPADDMAPPQPLLLPVNNKDAAAKLAVVNNPSVTAAEFTDAANKDAVDVAFAALMPQVDVQATAFNQQGSSGIGVKTSGGQVTAQLTVPLYQGGSEYAAIRQARAKEQQSFAAILDAQRTAYAQATQAWEALTSTRAAIVSTNAAIKADAIALDGTEREELVGTRTTLDVLNAQQLLLNAQVQQVQNIAQLVNNSYSVASAMGRLTAKDLALPVQEYDDLKYYDAVHYAGFGTGESADEDAGIAPNGALLAAPAAPGITDDATGAPTP